ncbi:MAG TPA: GNAT family N-acetyltransferase [Acidimicrobiales bacterium]|nr:GNAT family N-acetyltransferase [Acidimicrobiales bacterium]
MNRWDDPNGYWVSDDPNLLDIDFVHGWLNTQSYWARGRSRSAMEKAVTRSLNLGLFDANDQPAGFCRWVTDGTTFAWLCDVFVARAHRGEGRGTFLVGTAMRHPEVQGLRLLLGTKDAHGLYAKFGFTPLSLPDRLMEIWPDPPL